MWGRCYGHEMRSLHLRSAYKALASCYFLPNAQHAFVLFTSFRNTPIMTRFDFIKALAYDLIVPHLQNRLDTPSLQRDLRETSGRSWERTTPQLNEKRLKTEKQDPVTDWTSGKPVHLVHLSKEGRLPTCV
ncbi:hypothetical protein J6590_044623 [Homalodisca vitripennis]|nr:hypothetical protein J6590_044623 [Homalodisca vitripennis]